MTRLHDGVGSAARSNTIWVFGMVQTEVRKIFLKILPSRGHRDIVPFVVNWVERGSAIHSDSLPTYKILGSLGYNLYQINHSMGFPNMELIQIVLKVFLDV